MPLSTSHAPGDTITAADINAIAAAVNALGTGTAGTWAAYTPTLTGITLGNGTLVARYSQAGNVVHVNVELTFGTTSAMGGLGTDPRITLPVASSAHSQNLGIARYLDVSTALHYIGWWREGYFGRDGAAFGSITTTVPFTWATGDKLFAAMTYEAA